MRLDLGGWALLLIAMAIAYFVCLKADKEGTRLFKYGGYAIGVIILVISLILAISDVKTRFRRRRVAPRTSTRSAPSRPTIRPRMQPPAIPKTPDTSKPATK
jgi:hypothetical protein